MSDDEDALSEKLEPLDYKYTPPPTPIPEVTRTASSSPSSGASSASDTSKSSKSSQQHHQKKPRRKKPRDVPGQGDVVLFRYFAPNNPEIIRGSGGGRTFELASSDDSEGEERMDPKLQLPLSGSSLGHTAGSGLFGNDLSGTISAMATAATAVGATAMALNSTPAKRSRDETKETFATSHGPRAHLGSRSVDSTDPDKRKAPLPRPLNLSINISVPARSQRDAEAANGLVELRSDSPRRNSVAHETIATSPILQPHLISPSQGVAGSTLPALFAESAPVGETGATAAKKDVSLPSVSQLMAETRGNPDRPHSSSYSPGNSLPGGPSPPAGARVFSPPVQSPFQSSASLSRTTTLESRGTGSPGDKSSDGTKEFLPSEVDKKPYYQRRVPPKPTAPAPPFLSNNKSKSTSGSRSTASANTSTSTVYSSESFAVPADARAREDTPHSSASGGHQPATYLHYPSVPIGGYRCQHEGCDAAPFSTQYLLNSHANVHSQDRPHYCPVEGCARGKGGKGFKRKNEMIRHGLVHESPGYVCPWCPDREYKYPRPDNLQRHVRMHHEDKSRDDPALQAVLSQRTPGANNRGRRRRSRGASTS